MPGRRGADPYGSRLLPPLARARRALPPTGAETVYTIQTNGTLLDPEWAAFFKENEFLVGVSIDGPRDLHDAYRVNKGGKGSFDQVMRGLDPPRAAGVEWNALTTIHAANAEHGREVYRFLRDDSGARFVQFIPIIERVTEASADGAVPWNTWRRAATGSSRHRVLKAGLSRDVRLNTDEERDPRSCSRRSPASR